MNNASFDLTKKLSIILCCFNEEASIQKIITTLLSVAFPIPFELIVVDDASTDNTYSLLLEYKKEISHLIQHPFNKGKGAAIKTGLSMVTGDYVVIQDADLEYHPCDLLVLLPALLENKADAVYGSRFLNQKTPFNTYKIANSVLTFMTNLLTGLRLTDMETCYKMIKTSFIQKMELKENRFGIEPEITMKLFKLRAKILEYPILYSPRTVKEGKKIKAKDGFRAIYCLLKYRFFN